MNKSRAIKLALAMSREATSILDGLCRTSPFNFQPKVELMFREAQRAEAAATELRQSLKEKLNQRKKKS